jgi:hypothetical protein
MLLRTAIRPLSRPRSILSRPILVAFGLSISLPFLQPRQITRLDTSPYSPSAPSSASFSTSTIHTFPRRKNSPDERRKVTQSCRGEADQSGRDTGFRIWCVVECVFDEFDAVDRPGDRDLAGKILRHTTPYLVLWSLLYP